MQLSKLKPKTRKNWIGKKVELNTGAIVCSGQLKEVTNGKMVIIQFDKPLKDQSFFRETSAGLRTLKVDAKYVFI